MIFQLLNVFVDDLMEQIGLGSSKSDTLYFNWIDVSCNNVNVICYSDNESTLQELSMFHILIC